MISRVSLFLLFAEIAGGLIPAVAAQAQYATAYEPPPHFPYVGPTNSARAAPVVRKPHAKRRAAARRHSYGDTPTHGRRVAKVDNPASRAKSDRGKKKERVIHADAEVTILGSDRMIIRLFRKDHRATERSARAD